MASVTTTVTTDTLTPALERMLDALQDKAPLARLYGQLGLDSFEENFDVGGRPPWEKLSRVTLFLRKKAGHGSNRILWVTGTLKDIAYQAFADRVEFHTPPAARAYAAIQHYGGLAGRNRKDRKSVV